MPNCVCPYLPFLIQDGHRIMYVYIPDIKLPMVPLGTNKAASLLNISATVDCSSEKNDSSLDYIKIYVN